MKGTVPDGINERQSLGSGTEVVPGEENTEGWSRFMARRDCALVIIVLALNTLLLYILGDPEDPKAIWKRLEEQFQPKTWSKKLQLR